MDVPWGLCDMSRTVPVLAVCMQTACCTGRCAVLSSSCLQDPDKGEQRDPHAYATKRCNIGCFLACQPGNELRIHWCCLLLLLPMQEV